MNNELKNFKLTKSESQNITGGGGSCQTYRKTYHGDDWWKDDLDTCDEDPYTNA
jgi:hypothetical protein